MNATGRRSFILPLDKIGEVEVLNLGLLIAILLILRVEDRRFQLLLRVLRFTVTITALVGVGARAFLRLPSYKFILNRNNLLKQNNF